MKRIFARFVLSATVLAASLSSAQAQAPSGRGLLSLGRKPATEGASRPSPMPTPVMNDNSVELAAMESRTITIPAAGSAVAGQGVPSAQLINSRNLVIDFELKGLGPSGIGTVELWYTRNGQTWRKFAGLPQTQSPFVLDVTEDGLFGFSVVAKNGMGIGKSPPQPGDAPQVWVDVDTTKPEVHLVSTEAGVDESGRTLTLHWTATDRNLVPRPITLSYAERPEGPWVPFVTNLENSGVYTWHMSPGLPSRVLVRVEAVDRIGNLSEDRSMMPSPLDLTRPSVTIRNVSRNGVIIQQTGGR